MRKLLVLTGLCLALFVTPAMAAVNLGLPTNAKVNFDGNGVFSQFPGGSFDGLGPLPAAIGTELFGAGTISGIALQSDPGNAIWVPPAGVEMTFVFWDAVVTSSARIWTGTPGSSTALLSANYADGVRLLLVQDNTPDFSNVAGQGAFDLVDGEFPTAYTLEDAGYDSDGQPDGSSMFNIANDPGEEVFLDLLLDGNSSIIMWDGVRKTFVNGSFSSQFAEILGGTGAGQFSDFLGYDGSADAFIWQFQPLANWAFGGDIDIQLSAVPEPSTLIFFGTGLASVLGYGLRRKMA